MPKRFEPKETRSPGPHQVVSLRLADVSLERLLKGQDVQGRIWFTEHEDGAYELHASGVRIGDQREDGVPVAVDQLTNLINSFIERRWGDMSPESQADLDQTIDEWNTER